MHDPGGSGLTGGVQDIERSHDIRFDGLPGVDIGVGDGNQGAQVKDYFRVFYRLADGVAVPEVAHDDLDFLEALPGDQLQQPAVSPRVIAHESLDPGAASGQLLDEVAAGEAAAAGDPY